MPNAVSKNLKRWRENYVFSLTLAAMARPVWSVCRRVVSTLQTKIVRNGVTIQLPNGKKMTIGRDAGIGMASLLYWQGLEGYEPETSETLRFFYSRASTFVDVGANCGLYSILAGLWNPEIKVVAFEPLAPVYERLRKNVALNGLDERVLCENLALSSQTGATVLYLPQSDNGDIATTGTLASESWQARKGAARVEVRTVRFDDYERSHPMRVDLVKIDVEDFEADVLEGMSATIRRDRPFIICEILPRNKGHRNERTRRLIEALNYTAYWITASGYIRVSRFDFERNDKDFILSPVSIEGEIVTDLNLLLEKAASPASQDVHA